jgi:hypothetical protein
VNNGWLKQRADLRIRDSHPLTAGSLYGANQRTMLCHTLPSFFTSAVQQCKRNGAGWKQIVSGPMLA